MERKISFLRHFFVFILTVMIFVIGIYIGGQVENMRVEKLYDDLMENNLDFKNLQTEINYIDFLLSNSNFENNSCDQIKGAYFTSIRNLDDARLKLENYINFAKIKEEEFYRLKNQYLGTQINYYILAKNINDFCGDLNIILYFYGDKKKCPSCEDQGVHLTYVKQKLKDNVLIFALDTQRNGPIDLLKQRFDINNKELPVLIINDKEYGFLTNEEIFKILNYSN
jgi:thiol-disulfide isomerase/thioredoxin